MPDCQCTRLERMFDDKVARDDLRDYLRDGADRSTAMLIGALTQTGVADRTLLDIGGGIGSIQLELLAAGATSSTDVDASPAYLEVAEAEAAKRGFARRTTYRHGDFVGLADDVDSADIVTLDRVICCYPDLDALVSRSAAHARVRLGVVHPFDCWWMRAGSRVMNVFTRLFGNPRFFVHRTARLEAILRSAGFERESAAGTRMWRVAVYRRVTNVNG